MLAHLGELALLEMERRNFAMAERSRRSCVCWGSCCWTREIRARLGEAEVELLASALPEGSLVYEELAALAAKLEATRTPTG